IEKFANHWNATASAIALLRILFGIISANNTQAIGPQLIINDAVKIIINTSVIIPIVPVKVIILIPIIPIIIPVEPIIKSDLRTNLSTYIIATTVNTTFTNPITTV